MLSYRHAFHAGNHADVFKHVTLVECLAYMTKKEKPILHVDTHAGPGSTRLAEGYAAMNGEWAGGLGRLTALPGDEAVPDPVRAYLDLVYAYRSAREPDAYPGSPAIAAAMLRDCDRAVFCELHPADHDALEGSFRADPRIRTRRTDGFGALKSLLPPESRRGLVFIDPSYEIKDDYAKLVDALAFALGRFPTGVYCVWYPMLELDASRHLAGKVMSLSDRPALHATLRVRGLADGERGLAGSGMVVVNPPWSLEGKLETALPFLARVLAQDADAAWSLETIHCD